MVGAIFVQFWVERQNTGDGGIWAPASGIKLDEMTGVEGEGIFIELDEKCSSINQIQSNPFLGSLKTYKCLGICV